MHAKIPGRSAYSIISLSGVPGCLLPKVRGHYHEHQDPRKICIQHYITIRCSWMPLTKAKRALSCTKIPGRSACSIISLSGVPGCLLPKLRGHYHEHQDPRKICMQHYITIRCSWMPLTKAKRALS